MAIEGACDLFGQGAQARLQACALSATLEGRPQALELLTPLLQRCAAEGEPGLLRLASPSARLQLARHGLLSRWPSEAATASVEGVAPASAIAAPGLSSRELALALARDETVFTLSGRATVALSGGRTVELEPGDMAFFSSGEESVWTIHETLRKSFHADSAQPLPF